jgi:competence protein ComEC
VQGLTFSSAGWIALWAAPVQAVARQRGRLFLFVPVCLSLGIGGYFALPTEPVPQIWGGLVAVLVASVLVLWKSPPDLAPFVAVLVWVVAGVLLAGARTHLVAAPVLQYRFYGAIEGRIVKIDRAASDAIRLTLDRVALDGVSAARTPAYVRVTLHGDQRFLDPEPGLRVGLTGHLGPPPAPSEPGGFDFRRLAWFERLGAVGYTRNPVLLMAPPDTAQAGLQPHKLRMHMSRAIQDRLPGDAGAFATAILTGDRSAIPQAQLEDLRRSNLAHLLAISGLHMGLLTGIVFGLLRLVLVLVPWVALRLPTRKLAALGALAAGAFYLALSGGNVATQRAFIMVAVMLAAVLLDRRAFSLRSVALAAMLILLLRPEALVQAGFQMSFAATIALVAVFRAINDHPAQKRRVPRWVWPVASVVICSVVAGVATAPVAAAAFNRIADYGLLANLAAVPLMGAVIMPAAVLAALLTPFGLEGVGLSIMEPAILWILQVARFVSGLDGAVTGVVQPSGWVVPMLALGGLWLVIWQGRARWAGAGVIVCALAGWGVTDRPVLLIAPDASVVGVMTPQGRALSRDRAGRFSAESWLQADGDLAAQAEAYRRGVVQPAQGVALLTGSGMDVVHLFGTRGATQLDAVCLAGRIVVTNTDPETRPTGPCTLITPRDLAMTGAQAAWLRRGALVWQSDTQASGDRPWTGR